MLSKERALQIDRFPFMGQFSEELDGEYLV